MFQAALNEVKVLSMLSHPNIIEYYENFLEDKALMIVMEYAEGMIAFTLKCVYKLQDIFTLHIVFICVVIIFLLAMKVIFQFASVVS